MLPKLLLIMITYFKVLRGNEKTMGTMGTPNHSAVWRKVVSSRAGTPLKSYCTGFVDIGRMLRLSKPSADLTNADLSLPSTAVVVAPRILQCVFYAVQNSVVVETLRLSNAVGVNVAAVASKANGCRGQMLLTVADTMAVERCRRKTNKLSALTPQLTKTDLSNPSAGELKKYGLSRLTPQNLLCRGFGASRPKYCKTPEHDDAIKLCIFDVKC